MLGSQIRSVNIQPFALAIRIALLLKPCRPIFRELDGSLSRRSCHENCPQKSKTPMSNIGETLVL
jgi:hypothetical protein